MLQLFASEGFRPDVEFGCFSALFGPPGSGLEAEALLRVDIGNAQQGGHRRSLPIFLFMSRDDLFKCAAHLSFLLVEPIVRCSQRRIFHCAT